MRYAMQCIVDGAQAELSRGVCSSACLLPEEVAGYPPSAFAGGDGRRAHVDDDDGGSGGGGGESLRRITNSVHGRSSDESPPHAPSPHSPIDFDDSVINFMSNPSVGDGDGDDRRGSSSGSSSGKGGWVMSYHPPRYFDYSATDSPNADGTSSSSIVGSQHVLNE